MLIGVVSEGGGFVISTHLAGPWGQTLAGVA